MGTIRLLLAFAVLVSHASCFELDLLPGHVAVQVFFIISGFYMALILKEKYAACPVSVFYTNRLFRLFPTYLVVLALSVAALQIVGVGVFVTPGQFNRTIGHGLSTAVPLAWVNLAVVGQELGFMLGLTPETYTFFWADNQTSSFHMFFRYALVPQAWSLSMEFCFYLVAPFLLGRKARWLAALCLLSLALRTIILSYGDEFDSVARRFFPAELWLFLAGALSYLFFVRFKEAVNRLRAHSPLRAVAKAAMARRRLSTGLASEIKMDTILTVKIPRGLPRGGFKSKYLLGLGSWAALVALVVFYDRFDKRYALFVLAVVASAAIPFIFNLTRHSRFDRFLGNLSFPVYMVHFLIIALLETYVEEYAPWLLLCITGAAALGIYYGIEVPIDRWRQRRLIVSKAGSDSVEAWSPARIPASSSC